MYSNKYLDSFPRLVESATDRVALTTEMIVSGSGGYKSENIGLAELVLLCRQGEPMCAGPLSLFLVVCWQSLVSLGLSKSCSMCPCLNTPFSRDTNHFESGATTIMI